MSLLTARDLDFLLAIRGGESARGYAIRNNYSPRWAKWKSSEVRRKLGVGSLKEAAAMTEMTAEDAAAIRKELRELREAQEELRNAKTESEKAEAREDVRDAKSDLDDELRKRGLSKRDLDELQEAKEYEKFKARQDRLDKEKADAAVVAPPADEPAEEEEGVEPPPKMTKEKAEKVEEEAPRSQHWADKKLWGSKE